MMQNTAIGAVTYEGPMQRDLVVRAMAHDHEAFSELVRLSIDKLYAMLTETPIFEDRPSFAADGSIGWYGEGVDPCCVQVLEGDGDRVALPGEVPYWSPDGLLAVAAASSISSDQIIVARDGTIVATVPDALFPSWQRLAP